MATINDKIKAVHEAKEALREATEKADGYNQWLFCVHTRWEQPRVSVWEKSKFREKETATFILSDDGWQTLDLGGYDDEKATVEKAFEDWLAYDVGV